MQGGVMSNKPSLFIGSSSEGLEIARAVSVQLTEDTETTVWTDGVFPPGQSTIEALITAVGRFDFAVLVLTGDDLVSTRNQNKLAPRDNVLFELGLFMGRLGKSRTFILCDETPSVKLPSDIAGLTIARFDGNREDKIAAVGPACVLIRNVIRDLGIFEGKAVGKLDSATKDMQRTTMSMERLIKLQARSRIVELDVISKQFGAMMPKDQLARILQDLKDLEDATD